MHGLRVDDVFVANFHISAAPDQLAAVAAFVADEPRVIAAGNPAKVIREIDFKRSDEEEVVD